MKMRKDVQKSGQILKNTNKTIDTYLKRQKKKNFQKLKKWVAWGKKGSNFSLKIMENFQIVKNGKQ